jgi:fructose/tagatose bisphosphate aldolase
MSREDYNGAKWLQERKRRGSLPAAEGSVEGSPYANPFTMAAARGNRHGGGKRNIQRIIIGILKQRQEMTL